MEIKMNKEIRDYAETMFFGLSLRQFLFSALGCLLSVGIFFYSATGWEPRRSPGRAFWVSFPAGFSASQNITA